MRVKGWVPRAGGPGSKRRVSFSNRLTGKWKAKQTKKQTKCLIALYSSFTSASLWCVIRLKPRPSFSDSHSAHFHFPADIDLFCFVFWPPPNQKTLNRCLLLDATSSSSCPPTRTAVQRDAQLRRHYPCSPERGHRRAAQTLQAHSR